MHQIIFSTSPHSHKSNLGEIQQICKTPRLVVTRKLKEGSDHRQKGWKVERENAVRSILLKTEGEHAIVTINVD